MDLSQVKKVKKKEKTKHNSRGTKKSASDIISFMANGEEDLKEKNKDKNPISSQYDQWRVFQGREDAQMLQEKSVSWKSKKDWSEKYDRDYDD